MNTKQSQIDTSATRDILPTVMELSTFDFSKITLPASVGGHASYNGCPFEFVLSNNEWFQAPFGANDFKKNV